MADDLDDLLDEVESKFCKDSPSKKPAKNERAENSEQPQPPR